MKSLYYTGIPGKQHSRAPLTLPRSKRSEFEESGGYLPDSGLVDAVNVSLLLGQPLLLTGEPGVGKTQLAYSIAWELGFNPPLKFETKSTSVARDLFYTYDALGRFHAAQTTATNYADIDYLTYNALGIAIIRANTESAVAQWLPENFLHGGQQRSVVLIDEIDKAPRDFPNDVLNEVEGMYFRIPELGNVKVEAEETMKPILVITSNSEKQLPDAFLRRCIYYNIPFPETERLKQIVETRVGHLIRDKNQFFVDVLDLFYALRSPNNGLHKKPSTAELLGWLAVLSEFVTESDTPAKHRSQLIENSLSVLIKTAEDQKQAQIILKEWLQKKV